MSDSSSESGGESGLELGRAFVRDSGLVATRDAIVDPSEKEWFAYELVRSVLAGLSIGLEFTSPVVQALFQAVRCSTAPKQGAVNDLPASDQERRRIDAATAALEALAGPGITPGVHPVQEGTPDFSCSLTPHSPAESVASDSDSPVNAGLSSLISSAVLDHRNTLSLGGVLVDVITSDTGLQAAVLNIAISKSETSMRMLCARLRKRSRSHKDWANTRGDLIGLLMAPGVSQMVAAASIPKFHSTAELVSYDSSVMQKLRSTVKVIGTVMQTGADLLLRFRQGTLAQGNDVFLTVTRAKASDWPFHGELSADGVTVVFRCVAGDHQGHNGYTILRARFAVTMAGMNGGKALTLLNKELSKTSVREMVLRLRAPAGGPTADAQERGDGWSHEDLRTLVVGIYANGNMDLIIHSNEKDDRDKMYLRNVPRNQVSVRALPVDSLGVSAALDPPAAFAAYTGKNESGAFPWSVVDNGSRHYRVVLMGDGSDQAKSREHGHLNSVTVGFAGASKGMQVIGGSHLQFWPVGLWYGKDSREALMLHAKPIFEMWRHFKDKLDVEKESFGTGPTMEFAAALVDGKFIWECSGSGRGLSLCDDPTNNMPRALQQICDAKTGRQIHFPFMNLTAARHEEILKSGDRKVMAYRNVETPYIFVGLEKDKIIHGPLHTKGRSTDPYFRDIVFPALITSGQLQVWLNAHTKHLKGTMRHRCCQDTHDSKLKSTAPVGVSAMIFLNTHGDLFPFSCDKCDFHCPGGFEEVWDVTRLNLLLWRRSRRLLDTRDIEFQKRETRTFTGRVDLANSVLVLTSGSSRGLTFTLRKFLTYGRFLEDENNYETLVSSISECQIERHHLDVQDELAKAGHGGREKHAADRELGRSATVNRALVELNGNQIDRALTDQDTRIRQAARRQMRRESRLQNAYTMDDHCLQQFAKTGEVPRSSEAAALGLEEKKEGAEIETIQDQLEDFMDRFGILGELGYVVHEVGQPDSDAPPTYSCTVSCGDVLLGESSGLPTVEGAREVAAAAALDHETIQSAADERVAAQALQQEEESARKVSEYATGKEAIAHAKQFDAVSLEAGAGTNAAGEVVYKLTRVSTILGIRLHADMLIRILELRQRNGNLLLVDKDGLGNVKGILFKPPAIRAWSHDLLAGTIKIKMIDSAMCTIGKHSTPSAVDYSDGGIGASTEFTLKVGPNVSDQVQAFKNAHPVLAACFKEPSSYDLVPCGFDAVQYQMLLNQSIGPGSFCNDGRATGVLAQAQRNVQESLRWETGQEDDRQCALLYVCGHCGEAAYLMPGSVTPVVPGHAMNGLSCPAEGVHMCPYEGPTEEDNSETESDTPAAADDDAEAKDATTTTLSRCPENGCTNRSKGLCALHCAAQLHQVVTALEVRAKQQPPLGANQVDEIRKARKGYNDLKRTKNGKIRANVAKGPVLEATAVLLQLFGEVSVAAACAAEAGPQLPAQLPADPLLAGFVGMTPMLTEDADNVAVYPTPYREDRTMHHQQQRVTTAQGGHAAQSGAGQGRTAPSTQQQRGQGEIGITPTDQNKRRKQ